MRRAAPIFLTPDDLRSGMRRAGYRVDRVALSGLSTLATGLFLSLRFGEELAAQARHDARVTLYLRLRVRGNVPGDTVQCWRIRKSFDGAPEDGPPLALNLDLVLAGGITRGHLMERIERCRDPLRDLLDDVGAGVSRLEAAEAARRDGLVRLIAELEATFLDELWVGRGGLVLNVDKSAERSLAPKHLQAHLAVCRRVARDVLPDLERALGGIADRGRPPVPGANTAGASAMEPPQAVVV